MSGSEVPPVNPEKEGKDEEVEEKEEVEEREKEKSSADKEEGEVGAEREENKAGGEGEKEEVHIFGEDSVRREHKALCRDMFKKVTEYLNGELAGI